MKRSGTGVLLAVTLAGCGGAARAHRHASACLITESSNQLCGPAAISYCQLQMTHFLVQDFRFAWGLTNELTPDGLIPSCLKAGYRPTYRDKVYARLVFKDLNENNPGNGISDPLPAPTR